MKFNKFFPGRIPNDEDPVVNSFNSIRKHSLVGFSFLFRTGGRRGIYSVVVLVAVDTNQTGKYFFR